MIGMRSYNRSSEIPLSQREVTSVLSDPGFDHEIRRERWLATLSKEDRGYVLVLETEGVYLSHENPPFHLLAEKNQND